MLVTVLFRYTYQYYLHVYNPHNRNVEVMSTTDNLLSVLYCIVLHCNVMYYTVLHCIAMYCMRGVATVLSSMTGQSGLWQLSII